MDTLDHEHRDAFRSSTLGETLNFLLVVLILLSYAPQAWRIKSRRNIDGISPIFVFIGSVYSSSCLANILVLPSSWRMQQSCRERKVIGECLMEMMDIWSFAADYTGSHAILILYWYYYSDRSVDPEQQQEEEQEQEREENDNGQQNQSQHQDQSQEHGQRYRRQMSPSWRLKIVLGVCLDVVPLIPSIYFAINPRILSPGYYILIQCWSFGTVGLSTVLTLVYSLPQLYYTWKLGSVGSLSFLTMAIRIPTYFLVAASLAVRYGILDEITQPVGWFAGWNPWINLIIKGCQDGIILALCFYVRKTSATRETNPVLSEDTPLLSNIPDDHTT